MTVDKLTENRILIILSNKDMEDFSLSYDTLNLEDTHSRKILMRIMHLACFKSGVEIKNKRVFIESISLDDTCYLLITVENKDHTYNLKSSAHSSSICYKLGSSSNFLDAIEKLYQQKICCNRNSAYEYKGEYYIIFDYSSLPKNLMRILSEYGSRVSKNLSHVKIREYGKPICKNNAILQIGIHL